MSRTAQSIASNLRAKWPMGYAAPRQGGIMDALYLGFADGLADGEAAAERVYQEVHPRDADVLLGDFERVLGSDPCGYDSSDDSLDKRQARAWSRWVATGGQSIAYFTQLAANLGVAIEVQEFWPSIAGDMVAGGTLVPEGEQFIWLVKLALHNPDWFLAGRNEAFEPLFSFDISDIECVLHRLKPAHTTLIFSYQE